MSNYRKRHRSRSPPNAVARASKDVEILKLQQQFSNHPQLKRHEINIARGGKGSNVFIVTALRACDIPYQQRKAFQQKQLREWKYEMNKLIQVKSDGSAWKCAPIGVENNQDMAGPPMDFQFIVDYVEGTGVRTSNETSVCGCSCTDCYAQSEDPKYKNCCPAMADQQFPYTEDALVRLKPGTPVYECNSKCLCSIDCPNRVVQRGRKYPVCIFRTISRGWGLKAMEDIPENAFVVEYVGEIITNEDASKRQEEYDKQHRAYMFDLDYTDDTPRFVIDATRYGNEARFINHSCDPNMAVYGVWVDHLDPYMPRIAFFTKRFVAKGEELTFDYMMPVYDKRMDISQNYPQDKMIHCYCSSRKCRKFLLAL